MRHSFVGRTAGRKTASRPKRALHTFPGRCSGISGAEIAGGRCVFQAVRQRLVPHFRGFQKAEFAYTLLYKVLYLEVRGMCGRPRKYWVYRRVAGASDSAVAAGPGDVWL